MALDYAALLKPLSADAPCGADLDASDGLAVLNGMQVFGQQLRPLGELVPSIDPLQAGAQNTVRQYRWREVLDQASTTLAVGKDIRVLAHAAAAAVRVDGLEAFTQTLEVAVAWLDVFWDSVYPRLDPDADARSNALFSFADKMAILDAVRRVPLAVHKQLGSCSLRDVERAGNPITNGNDATANPQPRAIFDATPLEDLLALETIVGRGLQAVTAIESQMRDKTAGAAVPNLSGLSDLLKKIESTVAGYVDPRRKQAEPRPRVSSEGSAVAPPMSVAGAAMPVGAIRTRQDAIRALDAVAEFFRRNEPSSPVPLFVDRSKRLITMGFMELLADVAPAAVAQAKAAAGLPADSS
jgi:type VI secretion system protein ImpA